MAFVLAHAFNPIFESQRVKDEYGKEKERKKKERKRYRFVSVERRNAERREAKSIKMH